MVEVCSMEWLPFVFRALSFQIRSLLLPGHDEAVQVMHFVSLAAMSYVHFWAMLSAV